MDENNGAFAALLYSWRNPICRNHMLSWGGAQPCWYGNPKAQFWRERHATFGGSCGACCGNRGPLLKRKATTVQYHSPCRLPGSRTKGKNERGPAVTGRIAELKGELR